MGIDNPARPYAFDRVFAQSTIDATRTPQDLALQLYAMKDEMERQRQNAEQELGNARADGFAAGLAQARADAALALTAAQSALTEAIARLEDRFVDTETRIAGIAGGLVLTAAEMLAAHAIGERPGTAIDAAIGRVLVQTDFREALRLHLHPSSAGAVRLLLAERVSAAQRPLTITVHEDPTLAVGDAHILWDHGGLSLDAAARRAAVTAALGLSN